MEEDRAEAAAAAVVAVGRMRSRASAKRENGERGRHGSVGAVPENREIAMSQQGHRATRAQGEGMGADRRGR